MDLEVSALFFAVVAVALPRSLLAAAFEFARVAFTRDVSCAALRSFDESFPARAFDTSAVALSSRSSRAFVPVTKLLSVCFARADKESLTDLAILLGMGVDSAGMAGLWSRLLKAVVSVGTPAVLIIEDGASVLLIDER